MLLGPLASFFTKTQPNSIIVRSPVHDYTVRDIVAQDPSFIKLLDVVSAQDKESIKPILDSYFQRMVYQDFFKHYDIALSDELSWHLVMRQFGSQLTKENIPMIEHYINKNFGSKQNFLRVAKTELLAQYVKRSFHDFSALSGSDTKLDKANELIDRIVDIYSFDIDTIKKKLTLPHDEELMAYFDKNKAQYHTEPAAKAEYILIKHSDFKSNQDHQILVEELKQQGHTTIDDDLLEQYALHKAFEAIEQQAQALADASLLLDCMHEYGFNKESQEVNKTDYLTTMQLNDLIGHSIGLDQFIQHEEEETLLQWRVLPGEHARVFIKFLAVQPAMQLEYQEAASTVLNDWMVAKSYEQAIDYAQNLKDKLKVQENFDIKNYHQMKTHHVQNFFEAEKNSDLSNKMKIVIGSLYDPRVDAEKSSAMIIDRNKQQVYLIALREMDFGSLSSTKENFNLEEKDNLKVSQLSQYFHEISFDKALAYTLNKEFGYEIQEELWMLLKAVEQS